MAEVASDAGILERDHQEIEGKFPFLLGDFYILVDKGKWYRAFRFIRNYIERWHISGFVVKMK